MTRLEAIEMIDAHKNKLTNPVAMLRWTWVRVILHSLPDEQWQQALETAEKRLAQ